MEMFDVGEIPSQLFQLEGLTFLYLGTNNLTGTISADIGRLTMLNTLGFAQNLFHGW